MSSIREPQTSPAVTPVDMEGVRELLHRYARAVDTTDESLLEGCLADDVILHRVDGAREGIDAVIAFYRTVFEGPTVWSKHMVTNLVCTPTPKGFDVDAYFEAVSRTTDSAIMVLGEYHDQVVRAADGSLRIAVKRIDVQQIFPLAVDHG